MYEDTHPGNPDVCGMSLETCEEYKCGHWSLENLIMVETEMLKHKTFFFQNRFHFFFYTDIVCYSYSFKRQAFITLKITVTYMSIN